MAALIAEFISGPSWGARGGGEPRGGGGVGSRTPVPHRRAQPGDSVAERRADTWVSQPTQNSAPHPRCGLCAQVGVPRGTVAWGAGGGSWVAWLGGLGGPGEQRAAAEPIPVASEHPLICG